MATQPTQPTHPAHPAQPAQPKPPPAPPPPPKPPIPGPGGKSADPQDVKLNPPTPAPPRWDEGGRLDADPRPQAVEAEAWTPTPEIHPQDEKWPPGHYADGMPAADEQRARSAWIEQHGMKEWHEATDAPVEGEPRQVQGVRPTSRDERMGASR